MQRKTKSFALVGIALALAVASWRVAIPGGAAARSRQEEATATRPPAGEQGRSEETSDAAAERTRLESPPPPSIGPGSIPAHEVDPDDILRGRVVDPEGNRVPGAEIEVSRVGSREFSVLDLDYAREARTVARTQSDALGEFAVPLSRARPFDLVVVASGFARETVRSRYAGESVVVSLDRGAILLGRVTRAGDGSPVAGALVRGFPLGGPAEFFRGETDPAGVFRFESLMPGALVLEIVPPEDAAPGWTHLVLEDGQTLRKDFVVEPGVVVTGRVVDSVTKEPIEGAEIGEGWVFRRVVRTVADGTYAMRGYGSEGVRELAVRARGYGRQERRVDPKSSRPLEANFELLPARRARGRVLGSDGRPLPGVYVAAAASENRGEEQKIDWPSSRTGPDGRFEIRDLRPDVRHALFVREDGFGTLVHDFPNVNASVREVDLGDLTMRPAASIVGAVLGSGTEGLAGIEVVLKGTDRPGRHIDTYVARRTVRTDGRGRFQFGDVAAGTYEVRASARGRPPSEPVVARVEEGRACEGVLLRLESKLAIEGRVVDPYGRGVSGAYLSIEGGSPSPSASASTRSAADGSFRFEGLDPGPHRLRATLPSEREGSVAERLASTTVGGIDAGTKDVTVVLPRSAPITGRVVDGSGLPVAEATVVAQEEGGAPVASARTDGEGRFRLIVKEGERVQIRATPPRRTEDGRLLFAIEPGEPQLRGVAAGSEDVVVVIRARG